MSSDGVMTSVSESMEFDESSQQSKTTVDGKEVSSSSISKSKSSLTKTEAEPEPEKKLVKKKRTILPKKEETMQSIQLKPVAKKAATKEQEVVEEVKTEIKHQGADIGSGGVELDKLELKSKAAKPKEQVQIQVGKKILQDVARSPPCGFLKPPRKFFVDLSLYGVPLLFSRCNIDDLFFFPLYFFIVYQSSFVSMFLCSMFHV